MNVAESININSNPTQIWQVLTDPKIFNDCFKVLSIEYKNLIVGETIFFISSQQKDKAILTEVVSNKILAYDYYKANTKHSIHIQFEIIECDRDSILTINGSNFINEEVFIHSQQAWKSMLITIKNYIENKKS